jgi:hypothetical protein
MRRKKAIHGNGADALTPDFGKVRKDKIKKLEEIIHAQGRMLRDLNCRLRFVESVGKLIPAEQSKSVALKLRPNGRAE